MLHANVERTIEFYNEQIQVFLASGQPKSALEKVIKNDPTRFSWSSGDRTNAAKGDLYRLGEESFTIGAYRPFNRQHVYFNKSLNARTYRLQQMFPAPTVGNHGMHINIGGTDLSFCVLMIPSLPDLNFFGAGGQYFPRYTYIEGSHASELDIFEEEGTYSQVDNVTDEILAEYQLLYGSETTKDDVFFFVYGLLHSPDYRGTYASDLKKMLPHIPKLKAKKDFVSFFSAGRRLSALHLNYETVEPYPLDVTNLGASLLVNKMTFAGKAGAWDKSTIRYNDQITLRGIPDEAHEYMLGSRSAIEWILERYRVKTDKDSGIVNDPNDWGIEHGDPEYILNLLKRIVTVSIETVAIVKALPPLVIAE